MLQSSVIGSKKAFKLQEQEPAVNKAFGMQEVQSPVKERHDKHSGCLHNLQIISSTHPLVQEELQLEQLSGYLLKSQLLRQNKLLLHAAHPPTHPVVL